MNMKMRFLVLGIGYVILMWHSLGLPYNYFDLHSFDIIYDIKVVNTKRILHSLSHDHFI